MSNSIAHYCSQAAQATMAYGKRVVTLDRSEQEVGGDLTARLDGRVEKMEKAALKALALWFMIAVFAALSRSGAPFPCIMVALSSFALAVEIKEIILQHKARTRDNQNGWEI